MDVDSFTARLNEWGNEGIPFLFVADFELKKPLAIKLSDVDGRKVLFDINGFTNTVYPPSSSQISLREILRKEPIPSAEYLRKFDTVSHHLTYGDSYLTNLTIETGVQLTHTLQELFYISKARYKLWYQDEFLVFSPETFVQIREGKIYSYPMKGTIDATMKDAGTTILNDSKELAEHVTIVDLIRNDLSQVSNHVTVSRFRYIDELRTNNKTLLQVSSEIVGNLPNHYESQLGAILVSLLPAGSVSGAPKAKTVQIIHEAEGCDRGYYTGVFGYFDGEQLDAGVMIRYIEKRGDQYFYRSGGGITAQSKPESEYQEAIDKIYVPVD